MPSDTPVKDLTPPQAADVLNVPLEYLQRLLEEGSLPSVTSGRSCRIPVRAVLAYKERRDRERRTALRELTQLSDELGLYRPTPIPTDERTDE